jgi:hypothetical protein
VEGRRLIRMNWRTTGSGQTVPVVPEQEQVVTLVEDRSVLVLMSIGRSDRVKPNLPVNRNLSPPQERTRWTYCNADSARRLSLTYNDGSRTTVRLPQ